MDKNVRKLRLENRINLLQNKGDFNQRIVNKLKRELRKFQELKFTSIELVDGSRNVAIKIL